MISAIEAGGSSIKLGYSASETSSEDVELVEGTVTSVADMVDLSRRGAVHPRFATRHAIGVGGVVTRVDRLASGEFENTSSSLANTGESFRRREFAETSR